MVLNCKNCGGQLLFDNNTQTVVCEYCETSQSLKSIISNENSYIFESNDDISFIIKEYARAYSYMEIDDENYLLSAATIFESIPDIFNAKILAEECRKKSIYVRNEKTYLKAVEYMYSGDVKKIESAINLFQTIPNYKDATNKSQECKPLLEKAYQEQERQILIRKKQETQIKHKKRRKKIFILFLVVMVSAFMIALNHAKYSKSNIHISIEPSEKNYFIEKGSNYVFCYDVQLENNSLLDIKSIEADITIENEDEETLVNTDINFYNYSSSILRSKKKGVFTWELIVYSKRAAIELYECDFDDLTVEIDVVRVEYENGKTKEY